MLQRNRNWVRRDVVDVRCSNCWCTQALNLSGCARLCAACSAPVSSWSWAGRGRGQLSGQIVGQLFTVADLHREADADSRKRARRTRLRRGAAPSLGAPATSFPVETVVEIAQIDRTCSGECLGEGPVAGGDAGQRGSRRKVADNLVSCRRLSLFSGD